MAVADSLGAFLVSNLARSVLAGGSGTNITTSRGSSSTAPCSRGMASLTVADEVKRCFEMFLFEILLQATVVVRAAAFLHCCNNDRRILGLKFRATN